MQTHKAADIDEYIAAFPQHTQDYLREVRSAIMSLAPDAEETISYGMPAFTLKGDYLLYFAGYKNHIGIYPVPTREPELQKEFAGYKTSGKGTLQFPLNKPLPLPLLNKIIRYRLARSKAKSGADPISK